MTRDPSSGHAETSRPGASSNPTVTDRSLTRRGVPFWLTTFRLGLAPVLLGLAFAYPSRVLIVACLLAGSLSDILDGVLARGFEVVTPWLRRYDSATDMVYYLAVVVCFWGLHPAVFEQHVTFIAIVLGMEAICKGTCFARFGTWPAVHPLTGKLWGLTLFLAFAALFGWGQTWGLMTLALSVGVVVNLEVFAILWLVDEAPVDIPSVWHAWQEAP